MTTTHSRHGALLPAVTLLAVVASVALPAAVAAEPPADRAQVTVYSNGVDFLPGVEYSRAILTVSGNGLIFQRSLDPGQNLSICFYDPEGNLLPDGVYTWELELIPNSETRRELMVAASRNGGRAPEAWATQSGSFTIRDGSVALPEEAESNRNQRFESGLSSSLSLNQSQSTFETFATAVAAEDTDETVRSRPGLEKKLQAESSAGPQRPQFVGGLQHPDRGATERSDSAALALGQSLEPPLKNRKDAPDQFQDTPASPASKSNNSANGRDRSATDQ